jgi:hypothetical protein
MQLKIWGVFGKQKKGGSGRPSLLPSLPGSATEKM